MICSSQRRPRAGRKKLKIFYWRHILPAFEDYVIDQWKIYEECERNCGKPIDRAIRSTSNPKTKKYIAFSTPLTPCHVNYQKDL